MKILMVNDYKDEIGGAEVYMYTLKKHLELAGHDVRVVSTNISKAEYLKRADIVSVQTYLNRIFNLRTFLEFRKLLSTWQPDIIHIHSYYELSPSFLALSGDIPVIMTIHDQRIKSAVIDPGCSYSKTHGNICPGCTECVGFKGMLFERVKNFIHGFFTIKIHLYLVPSQFLLLQLKQFKDLQPIEQLYNGFELPHYTALQLTQKILYAGRLAENKGAQYLIAALPQILKIFARARLTLLGAGNYEDELKQLVKKLEIEDFVTFLGAVTNKKVVQCIYDADVVSVPSAYDDNLPTIAMEALAAGRPVIASDIGGLPEIIDDGVTGYLVKPKDAKQIADKVVTLFKDHKLMKKMSGAAREQSAQFEINSHIKKIISIYQAHAISHKR